MPTEYQHSRPSLSLAGNLAGVAVGEGAQRAPGLAAGTTWVSPWGCFSAPSPSRTFWVFSEAALRGPHLVPAAALVVPKAGLDLHGVCPACRATGPHPREIMAVARSGAGVLRPPWGLLWAAVGAWFHRSPLTPWGGVSVPHSSPPLQGREGQPRDQPLGGPAAGGAAAGRAGGTGPECAAGGPGPARCPVTPGGRLVPAQTLLRVARLLWTVTWEPGSRARAEGPCSAEQLFLRPRLAWCQAGMQGVGCLL